MTVGPIRPYQAYQPYQPIQAPHSPSESEQTGQVFGIKNSNDSQKAEKIPEKTECQTCANRKYMDGSNEADVSFKSASHVAPEAAASAVRSHEMMHVANAYQKAEEGNGKVISANVAIHTSICPECGRTYVSGGTTTTQIKYTNEENPYQKDLKAQQESILAGANINYAV